MQDGACDPEPARRDRFLFTISSCRTRQWPGLLRMAREIRPGLKAIFTSGYSEQFIRARGDGRGVPSFPSPTAGKSCSTSSANVLAPDLTLRRADPLSLPWATTMAAMPCARPPPSELRMMRMNAHLELRPVISNTKCPSSTITLRGISAGAGPECASRPCPPPCQASSARAHRRRCQVGPPCHVTALSSV